MEWKRYSLEQPENGKVIIQLDDPFELYKGKFAMHYTMGMREYNSQCSHADLVNWCKENGIKLFDFWWVYAEDFCFPE